MSFALETFRKRLALVVLEEGQVFSLDLLWYFVQLVPVVSLALRTQPTMPTQVVC